MTIHQILQHYWKHAAFRPLQEDVIESVLAGHDTLALMPTGGGKSLCFQVPAMAKPGICLVVSPLIALMKDQVENLRSRGINALAIVSGMGKREVDIALDNCIYGPVKFLYLSPERLLSELVQTRIRHMNVNLIAVDEAHCISQWGYDFRPPYLHLADLRQLHPEVPVLALTATATQRVVEDIQQKLAFRESRVFRKSFARDNLAYMVVNEEDKFKKLIAIAKKNKGSGIVYVRNRRETQEVARLLNREGIRADFYHAGLENTLRSARQESWKLNAIQVMVATNAFGMGIDKPDVRFVVHLDLPESLEAYYQEAGRAGRDEKKAFAVLLYNRSDKLQLQKKFELSFPSIDEIKNVYQQLGNYFQLAYGAGEGLTLDFDIAEFCNRFKLDAIKTLNALKFLEHDEYISISESVYLPSRVMITVSAEDLYRFQIENQGFDQFIKVLLRSYGGMFDQFVPIRESDIARRTGQNMIQVAEALKRLEQLELLSYKAQTDKPQLQFIRPRTDITSLYIDRQYIEERRQVMKQQIDAAIKYAESNSCRSRLLLAYFDEPDAPKCGICDVCLAEKYKNDAADRIDTILNQVLQLLSGNHLLLDDLIAQTEMGTEKEKLDVIRNLLDAGKIKTDGKYYYI
ncbi:RecQ family ATP-dependent DNA helicase [Pedobacter sp. BS3]|uniref:RecQ family ATP-dependent DNA helicase n=1 Tax=Pedobacter sp. BS3 TaxID=2567937 RepID=UPI0011EDDDE3|nr:ATP-dependent DNA helicase RecQ [Pedobacter sp. BS3]TZF84821.1 RecQ family ATP-dependent DNA helicase [Pedobacter sp. BS3]